MTNDNKFAGPNEAMLEWSVAPLEYIHAQLQNMPSQVLRDQIRYCESGIRLQDQYAEATTTRAKALLDMRPSSTADSLSAERAMEFDQILLAMNADAATAMQLSDAMQVLSNKMMLVLASRGEAV